MSVLHILRTPMKEIDRQPNGEPRWCFECRKRVAFEKVVTTPVDPMSYYGPNACVKCINGHVDGDCFPGRWREWSEGGMS